MGIKMTHSGSLGLSHSITVSDDVLEHALHLVQRSEEEEIIYLSSELKQKLQRLCKEFTDNIVKLDKQEVMSINAFNILLETAEQWRKEKEKEIDQYVSKRNFNALKKMKTDIDTKRITPAADIRISFDESGQPYSTNSKYYKKMYTSNYTEGRKLRKKYGY